MATKSLSLQPNILLGTCLCLLAMILSFAFDCGPASAADPPRDSRTTVTSHRDSLTVSVTQRHRATRPGSAGSHRSSSSPRRSSSGSGSICPTTPGTSADACHFALAILDILRGPRTTTSTTASRPTPTQIHEQLLQEIKHLPAPPPNITFQPAHHQTLIGVPTIIITNTKTHTTTLTILNQPITVRLTPTRWEVNPGDNTPPVTTTKPAAPYPNHTFTLTHHHKGTFQVTATLTWQVHYQTQDSPTWTPAGTITSTQPPTPITVREAKTRLTHKPK